jgi:hypothetical protein
LVSNRCTVEAASRIDELVLSQSGDRLAACWWFLPTTSALTGSPLLGTVGSGGHDVAGALAEQLVRAIVVVAWMPRHADRH